MKFIVILICLAVERWSSFGKQIRRFSLLTKYIALFSGIRLSPYIGLAAILLPLMIIMGVAYWLLWHFWFGFFAVVFAVAVLLYCLDAFESRHTIDLAEQINFEAPYDKLIVTQLVQANHSIFAILFWFIILGPMGAVLYRLNDVLTHQNKMAHYALAAKSFENVLDWIPVRLFALSFALMSHFMAVLKSWIQDVLKGIQSNTLLLANCGFAALEQERKKQHVTQEEIYTQVQEMIDRSLILWLVVLAVTILL